MGIFPLSNNALWSEQLLGRSIVGLTNKHKGTRGGATGVRVACHLGFDNGPTSRNSINELVELFHDASVPCPGSPHREKLSLQFLIKHSFKCFARWVQDT